MTLLLVGQSDSEVVGFPCAYRFSDLACVTSKKLQGHIHERLPFCGKRYDKNGVRRFPLALVAPCIIG
jgi:hypothetical protein